MLKVNNAYVETMTQIGRISVDSEQWEEFASDAHDAILESLKVMDDESLRKELSGVGEKLEDIIHTYGNKEEIICGE